MKQRKQKGLVSEVGIVGIPTDLIAKDWLYQTRTRRLGYIPTTQFDECFLDRIKIISFWSYTLKLTHVQSNGGQRASNRGLH